MTLSCRRGFAAVITLFLSLFILSSPIRGMTWPAHPNTAPVQSPTRQDIEDLLVQLNSSRYFNTIQDLAAFNRYTHSPDILNARDYIQSEFMALGLAVELQSFAVGSSTAYNVIGTLPGTTRPDDWYIICGHYDSTSEIPGTAAPGAEDNASGTAGIIEIARVLADEPQAATIKFVAFAGEEQGLYGSNAYVQGLTNAGDLTKVRDVLVMDMISFTADNDLDVLLETRPFAQSVLDILQLSAAEFTMLRVVTSFNACCSDHMPFLNNNVKAVLAIENDYSIYPHYHRSTDTPDQIDVNMGMEILKMNLATLAQLISGALKSVKITSPNGGQNWQTGSTQTILWTSTGPVNDVKIELSRDGGTSYDVLFAGTPNDGSQVWTVTGPATTNAFVRITDFDDPMVFDLSNNTFTISDPPPPPPPPPPPTGCAAGKVVEGKADAARVLGLMYRFRDEVLARTPRGREYTQQFYLYSPEIIQILTLDPEVLFRVQRDLDAYTINLESRIDTGAMTLTGDDLKTIDDLLRSIGAKASTGLRFEIETLRRELHDPDVLAEFGIRVLD